MNRVAAFQTAICTLAMSVLSAGTSVFVLQAHTGIVKPLGLLVAVGCIAIGTWLVYLGHCRSLLPRAARGQ